MKDIGLYLHIPFCASKCPYCDFYSFRGTEEEKDAYINALLNEIEKKAVEFRCKANTLYIGGGTPSVIGFERLQSLVKKAKECCLGENAEITVECNPYSLQDGFFYGLAESGVNRISIGLQSADNGERKILGRRGTADDVKTAIFNARAAGINNISLDVMLGIPESNMQSLERTLQFCTQQDIPHISCYILKLEQGTPFYKMQKKLSLPDEDSVAEMYLYMCDYLEKNGIHQYEISNFSKAGAESRHNLKYWNCEQYLGLGAAAHSFINGKRFYYKRSVVDFISGKEPVADGVGGDFEEFSMLALRLASGLENSKTYERFGFEIPKEMYEKAAKFTDNGYAVADDRGIRLTAKGFLISNYIISELI